MGDHEPRLARCMCGARLSPCQRCLEDRCYQCDPLGSSQCDEDADEKADSLARARKVRQVKGGGW